MRASSLGPVGRHRVTVDSSEPSGVGTHGVSGTIARKWLREMPVDGPAGICLGNHLNVVAWEQGLQVRMGLRNPVVGTGVEDELAHRSGRQYCDQNGPIASPVYEPILKGRQLLHFLCLRESILVGRLHANGDADLDVVR